MLPKKTALLSKKSNFWQASDRVVTIDVSFFRCSRPEIVYKTGVLKNFVKFTEKHLRRSLGFNKVAGLQAGAISRKRLRHRCFPVNFAKFFRTPILQNKSELLLLRFEEVSKRI